MLQDTGPATALPPNSSNWAVTVWRQRRLALAIAASVTALGALYAYARSPKFEVVTAIDIGYRGLGSRIADYSAGPQFIETPEIVSARLNQAYLPNVLMLARAEGKVAGAGPSVTATITKGTSIVLLKSLATVEQAPQHLAIHGAAAKLLLENHANQTNVAAAAIEQHRAAMNYELIQLGEPSELAADAAPIETKVAALTAQVSNAALTSDARQVLSSQIDNARRTLEQYKRAQEVAQRQAELRDVERKQKEKRADEIRHQVDAVRADRTKAVSASISPVEAMAMMVMDSEIQRRAEELSRIEQDLLVADEVRRVAELSSRSQSRLAIQSKMRELDVFASAIIPTRLLTAPTLTEFRGGTGRLALIVLSALLGLVLGIGTVLLSDWVKRLKLAA